MSSGIELQDNPLAPMLSAHAYNANSVARFAPYAPHYTEFALMGSGAPQPTQFNPCDWIGLAALLVRYQVEDLAILRYCLQHAPDKGALRRWRAVP
jgi:hypothetical protein